MPMVARNSCANEPRPDACHGPASADRADSGLGTAAWEHDMLSYLHNAAGDDDGPLTVNPKLQVSTRSASEPLESLRWSTSHIC